MANSNYLNRIFVVHEDENRQSPLRLALEDGKRDLAQILLDAGAEPDDEDKELINDWEWESDSDSDLDTDFYVSEYGGSRGTNIRPEYDYKFYYGPDLGRGKRQSSIKEYFARL